MRIIQTKAAIRQVIVANCETYHYLKIVLRRIERIAHTIWVYLACIIYPSNLHRIGLVISYRD